MTTCRSAFVAAIVAALASNSAIAQLQEDVPNHTAAVRALERELADAMHARDQGRLEQLLAADYVLRGAPDIDRATWLRNALTLCWGDRSDIEEFRAREHDDVVVAAFELTFYVDPATCRPAVLRSLITDVWVRRPDGWRLVIRHSAPPPADAGIAAQYGIVPDPPPAWDLSSELSFVATGGNTSTRTIGVGGSVTHRGAFGSTRAAVAFLTSEADAVTRARSFTTEARHGIRIGPQLELFGRGSYARDRFAGIEHRVAADAGAAYTALLPRAHALTTEGSVGFTAEQRLDTTDLRFVTATGALNYVWTIAAGTKLLQEADLIADLETARNWRGTSTTAVTVTLTRLLSLKASHAIEYRNTPVAGFGRTDMRTAAALVLSFQRAPSVP